MPRGRLFARWMPRASSARWSVADGRPSQSVLLLWMHSSAHSPQAIVGTSIRRISHSPMVLPRCPTVRTHRVPSVSTLFHAISPPARPPIPAAAFAALLCQSCRHGAHPSYRQNGSGSRPMRTAHCTYRTPTRVESTGPDPPRVGPAGHSAINGLARSAATAQAAAWHGVAALRRPAGASSASLDARGGARPTLRSERRPGRAAALRDGYCVAWDIVSDAALRCARYCVA